MHQNVWDFTRKQKGYKTASDLKNTRNAICKVHSFLHIKNKLMQNKKRSFGEQARFLENSPIRLSISFKIVLVSSSVVFASEGSEWGGEEKAQPWNNKRGNIVVKKSISRWNHSSEKYFAATQIISEFWPKSLIYLDDFWKGGASSANSVVKIGRWRYFDFSGKKKVTNFNSTWLNFNSDI